MYSNRLGEQFFNLFSNVLYILPVQ